MDKQIQEAPQSFRGRMFRPDTAKPKEQRIMVLKTGVAGIRFHIENEEEDQALREIAPGTELQLYREPDNEHDEWAVAVYRTETDKIGYITRYKNESIARLMDVGKKFIAIVDDPENDEEAAAIVEQDKNRHKQAPTEDMSLPISIYMIEDA